MVGKVKTINIKNDILIYKKELQSFIEILKLEPNKNLILKNSTNEDYIKFITKKLLFYKKIYEENQTDNYFNTIIYSLLKCINLLFSDSWTVECFNMYNRMFIEHFIKMLINIEPTPWKSIENIILELVRKNTTPQNIIENLNYLKSIYKNQSCGIHGGKSIHEDIKFYYTEIKDNSIIEYKNGTKIIKDMMTVLNKSINLIIYFRLDTISKTFNGRMPELKFLIGDEKYKIYRDKIYE